MSSNELNSDAVSRSTAIDLLRIAVARLTDEETSMCKAAADRDIFCRGYRRLTDSELRERYDWIVRKRPAISRPELESIANLWELTQQEVHGLRTSCDVQAKVCDTCNGWREFSDEDLSRFYFEMTGRSLRISC